MKKMNETTVRRDVTERVGKGGLRRVLCARFCVNSPDRNATEQTE